MIDDYDLFCNLESQSEPCHRGVAIYVHKSLAASELKTDVTFREALWVEVKTEEEDSMIIGCIYRSPTRARDNNDVKLLDVIAEMTNKAKG